MALEKNQVSNVIFADYSGGINVSVAPQLLAENEYQQIRNMEFDYNILKTRGGVSAALSSYPADIKSVFWDMATNCYLVCLKDGSVYEENLSGLHNKVGTLSGKKSVSYCKFDGKIFVASGGKLQYYDYAGHSLTTIEASYLSDIVFERMGRLVTSMQGDDNLYYSAVGDPYETGWEEDSNRDDSSKFVEIGYKDDGDIMKALPMSGDIIVLKSNGSIYALSGEYPSWTVQMVASNIDLISADSITWLDNQVCYLTNKGLNVLQPTQAYGNYSTNLNVGRKFNKLIVEKLANPVMCNAVRKHQLLVQPDSADKGYVICYQYDLGAAITFRFPLEISCIVDTENGVIFAAGKSLYRWDKRYVNDLGNTPIEQEIVTRKFDSSRQLFTRQVDVGVNGTEGGVVELLWADKTLKYTIKNKRRVLKVFSVCRDGVFRVRTQDNVAFEYIKFYLFEK